MEIPADFAQRMMEVHGAAGRAWLAGLPGLLAACAADWGLKVGPPFPLSYNYVAPATRADGTEVVLKVGVPCVGLWGEMAALRVYDGRGSVQLLAADHERGVMLLERLRPGTTLLAVEDDPAATEIAAGVMRALRHPPPADHAFRTVDAWAAGLGKLRARFGGATGPLPADLVLRAESLFAELLASQAPPVVLHADLHHGNILAATRAPWLAVDPQGVVGEPASEVGVWLHNPLPQLLQQPDPSRILARRIDQLSDLLGFDRTRIHAWGLATAVLSAWWSIEDHGYGWEGAIAVARLLAALPG